MAGDPKSGLLLWEPSLGPWLFSYPINYLTPLTPEITFNPHTLRRFCGGSVALLSGFSECDGKASQSMLAQHGTVQRRSVKGPYVETSSVMNVRTNPATEGLLVRRETAITAPWPHTQCQHCLHAPKSSNQARVLSKWDQTSADALAKGKGTHSETHEHFNIFKPLQAV